MASYKNLLKAANQVDSEATVVPWWRKKSNKKVKPTWSKQGWRQTHGAWHSGGGWQWENASRTGGGWQDKSYQGENASRTGGGWQDKSYASSSSEAPWVDGVWRKDESTGWCEWVAHTDNAADDDGGSVGRATQELASMSLQVQVREPTEKVSAPEKVTVDPDMQAQSAT
eukprot:GEMP01109685.1.p1 GENE.GEMP01109685.1~~GEMP01109685.1.p1  ORF type:complete len:183 (+),score=51.65 GEMP01109685.1:41-550(+)